MEIQISQKLALQLHPQTWCCDAVWFRACPLRGCFSRTGPIKTTVLSKGLKGSSMLVWEGTLYWFAATELKADGYNQETLF